MLWMPQEIFVDALYIIYKLYILCIKKTIEINGWHKKNKVTCFLADYRRF